MSSLRTRASTGSLLEQTRRVLASWLSAAFALGCSADPATPHGDAAPEPEHWALVSQPASNTLAVLDPTHGTARERLTVGGLPHRIVLTRDNQRAYVVLVGSQAIAEIDTTTLELTRTLLTAPMPETRDDGARIDEHFAEGAFSATSCFDCHRPGGAKPFIVGERPFGIALSEDENTLYITHINSARLSVIDRSSGELTRSVHLDPAGSAGEAAELTRLGDRLAVALRERQPSNVPGALRFLDTQTLEALEADVPVGADPISLTPLERRGSVLVSNFDTNTLSEISPGGLTTSFTLAPGPLGTELLDGQNRVLALDYYSNALSHLDLSSGAAETSPLEFEGTILANPTHSALSPSGRLAYVVTSGTDGKLAVYDLDERRVLRTLSIEGLSFDVAVVPGE